MYISKLPGILKRNVLRHSHHLIFMMSILSLTLLAAWWSVFINQSIEHHRSHHLENLKLSMDYISMRLGLDKENRPSTGIYETDNRFEVAPCSGTGTNFAKPLLPAWPGLCIKTRESVLTEIEQDFKRKKLMVAGESGVLVFVILLSSIFLYRFIKLERRSAGEVEEFWGRVTHEIKTPITGIKAFLQSLKNQSIDPAQLPLFVDMALKQVEKQEQLAENILAGYGLRSGKSNYLPRITGLNLNEWVRGYFDGHVLDLTDARVSLRMEPGKDLKVQADGNILRVILDNIVDNALKYCSPGLILEVEVLVKDKKAILSVTDNGPGFQPEFSERIFNAYKYSKSELPAAEHGSGMGLYISRRLAEKMGGRLTASSKGTGQGAEFQLFLNISRV